MKIMASLTSAQFCMFVITTALSTSIVAGTGFGSFPSIPSLPVRPPPAVSSAFGSVAGESTLIDDSTFEEELKGGGCRGQLITTLQTTLHDVIVNQIPTTPLPFDQVLREAVSNILGRLLENIIEENATGGNAADATSTGFMVACSFEPQLADACMAARPMVRRAALEAFRVLCRTSDCCRKPAQP